MRRCVSSICKNIVINVSFRYTEVIYFQGVYVSKGYNLANIAENSNFSKVFFYGTYKFRIHYSDKYDKSYGCVIFVIDVKRPWETV